MNAQRKLISIAFALGLGLSTQALGDSCSEVNLYADHGPLNSVPIYEQGETYLCYAYAVAQMAEYSLRKSGDWQRTYGDDAHLNAVWAALAHKTSKDIGLRLNPKQLGQGFFKTAYNDLLERGVCDPTVFEKSLADFKGQSVLSDPDFLYLFEAVWDLTAQNKVNAKSLDALLSRPDFKRMTDRIFPNGGGAQMKSEIIRLRDQVSKIPSGWFEKNDQTSYFRDVVFPSCSGSAVKPVALPKVRTMGLGFASRAKLKRHIDAVLDSSSPEPITIGYCSGIYHEGERAEKAGKRKALLPRFFRAFSKNCSTHYSLLVGRKRSAKTGKCEYLIRNTMGRDFWTKKSSCLCEKTDGSGYEECWYDPVLSPKSDRVVGCYIDELPLLNSVYDLVFLDRK